MPPKKSTRAAASEEGGLVLLAYTGEGERTIEHPTTGLTYTFNPQTPTWAPADLATRLTRDDPARFAIAKPEPTYETLGGA